MRTVGDRFLVPSVRIWYESSVLGWGWLGSNRDGRPIVPVPRVAERLDLYGLKAAQGVFDSRRRLKRYQLDNAPCELRNEKFAESGVERLGLYRVG